MPASLPAATSARLRGADALVRQRFAVVGLDGFVDSIIRVVGKRDANGQREFLPDIGAFARRVAAAAGLSTAMELITTQVKLGGNGPIMANAMAAWGLPLAYLGAVGEGDGLHPVFQPMAERATVYSVCPAARTDALEFDDGKIMLQRMECLDTLDFALLDRVIGRDQLVALFERADFVALNHWASLPRMTSIWRDLQRELLPQLSPRPRQAFFDLADLQKRSPEDIGEALAVLGDFEPTWQVHLGLNEAESDRVAEVYGAEPAEADHRARLLARAERLQRHLRLSSVAIHPVAFAAAADRQGSAVVDGPYTAKPKISTGAGDHFNAGYCLGRLLGADTATSLQLGVASSGYYVRQAASPSIPELATFLTQLAG